MCFNDLGTRYYVRVRSKHFKENKIHTIYNISIIVQRKIK